VLDKLNKITHKKNSNTQMNQIIQTHQSKEENVRVPLRTYPRLLFFESCLKFISDMSQTSLAQNQAVTSSIYILNHKFLYLRGGNERVGVILMNCMKKLRGSHVNNMKLYCFIATI
jgi:hypothetical protein